MKIFNKLILIALFFPLLAWGETAGQDLAKLLGSINTMQGKFVQTMENNNLGSGQKSSGVFAMQRPGKFRWEIFNPSHQLILVSGDIILIYNDDLKQVSRQKVDYRQTNNPIFLLSSSTLELQNNFYIKRLLSIPDGYSCFELRPKTKDDFFQKVIIKFKQNKLHSMFVLDNLGQKTNFDFFGVDFNVSLDKKVFIFIPPKGVDYYE